MEEVLDFSMCGLFYITDPLTLLRREKMSLVCVFHLLHDKSLRLEVKRTQPTAFLKPLWLHRDQRTQDIHIKL